MASIKAISCFLKSIDDEATMLEVIEDDNVIHVQSTYPEARVPNINRYPYNVKLNWQDKKLRTYTGRKVELQLVDGVVEKIIPLS